jgi:hypothetical protein
LCHQFADLFGRAFDCYLGPGVCGNVGFSHIQVFCLATRLEYMNMIHCQECCYRRQGREGPPIFMEGARCSPGSVPSNRTVPA